MAQKRRCSRAIEKMNRIEEKEEEFTVELMDISWKMELENLQQQLEEMKVLFGNRNIGGGRSKEAS